jgi:hypothetical protein
MRSRKRHEHERYRPAEVRARDRLHQLQESVSVTIKAVETRNR